jgi:DNA polymerase-3 subunit delta'
VSSRWKVAGHARTVEMLARSLDSPAHAYLFLGPKRIGKTTLALEMAKALNCTGEGPPCQACHDCGLISRHTHPDVTYIAPNDKDVLTIEAIRQLRQDIRFRPNQARWRVFILPADRLNDPAADALLKTLEEPPEYAVLILTGQDLPAISETVVSRCRLVVMGSVEAGLIEAELVERGLEPPKAKQLSRLAFGAPGWAIEASEDEDMVVRRANTMEQLGRWTSVSLLDRMAAAESLVAGAGRLEAARLAALEELELLIVWWRDVLAATCGQSALLSDAVDRNEIERVAAGETPESALGVVRAITTAATRIKEYTDPRLSLEALAVARGV